MVDRGGGSRTLVGIVSAVGTPVGPPTIRYRMDLQYDGQAFYGWARQPGIPTVEGALESAFATVLGMVPRLSVAGRTDAGVHARRQVVSLDLPVSGPGSPFRSARLMHSLNALTPAGVMITSLRPATPGFDARRDAVGRSYRYFITLGPTQSPFRRAYAWHVGYPLDLVAMEVAARLVDRKSLV
jgi:Pseudouridylate synthase